MFGGKKEKVTLDKHKNVKQQRQQYCLKTTL